MEIKIGTQFTTFNDVKIKIIDIFSYVSPSKNYDTYVVYEYSFNRSFFSKSVLSEQTVNGTDKVSMETFIKEFYQ